MLRIRNFFIEILKKLGLINSIHYVNGPETLPAPLTKKEEEKVMERIKRGEKNAKEILITHNLRLVVYIAKKFESSNISLEDLVSIGTIGLMKAVNTFCPEKNIKLATYASRCIENEILMFLRKSSQMKSEVSIDEPLNIDWDGNELLLSDILGSDQDVVNKEIEKESECKVIRGVISSLCEREKNIMELRFGLCGKKEHTQKEVADFLGISQSYISRLEKRIISKLKREIERVC